jgi:MerR family transcriptional regulator/heat shock protein HspR
MEKDRKKPLYTIGVASDLVKVCPATLRLWEKNNLLKPNRLGKNRFYSESDIDRLRLIKDFIQKKGIGLKSLKIVMETKFCWDIKHCSAEIKQQCVIFQQFKDGNILSGFISNKKEGKNGKTQLLGI